MALSASAFATAIRKHYPALVVPSKVPKSFYIRVGKAIKECGYSQEDGEAIGLWLSRQKWITQPMSLLTVALKGGEWLAKAKAEKPSKPVAERKDAWLDTDGLEI